MRVNFFCSILIVISFSTLSAQTDTIFNQLDGNGMRQGFWKKEYPNGKRMYLGFFKNGKPAREMRRYYESGELQTLMVFDITGEYSNVIFFYDTGEKAAEGLYHNEKKDSTWQYYSYYTQSIISSEVYSNGIKNGVEKHFYANGQVSEEIFWQNDFKNGLWNQYFEDGKAKLKANYAFNAVNGGYKVFYPAGNLFILGQYLENERHGKWIFFDETGKEKYQLAYVNGKAENEEAVIAKDQEFFKMVEENMGKFQEPTVEDLLPASGY